MKRLRERKRGISLDDAGQQMVASGGVFFDCF